MLEDQLLLVVQYIQHVTQQHTEQQLQHNTQHLNLLLLHGGGLLQSLNQPLHGGNPVQQLHIAQ